VVVTVKKRQARNEVPSPQVKGITSTPKRNASGGLYRGRFSCPDVQWTGAAPDVFATFTITAEELADAADNGLIWTDQDVQRGIQPGLAISPPRELSLRDGYPNAALYIFDADKADEIAEKLLRGDKTYLNPLVWNLRPSAFEAYWDGAERQLDVYSGRIYLPDSHHRHQAIVKAVKTWREAPRDYPKFSGSNQFKVELYFLSRTDEGNFFYDKNQLPKPTAKSKAYDLTTVDALSLLAKRVIEQSKHLKSNVNRVTDRLSPKNPQVVTLSTLREMMKSFAPDEELDELELEGLAIVAAQFYDLLVDVRPELGHLSVAQRKLTRQSSLVDSAVMMHGYAALMRDFNNDLARSGKQRALGEWKKKLGRLAASTIYTLNGWSGDLLAKDNPLWQRVGVVKPGKDAAKLTVLNTGAARSECGRVLRTLLSAPSGTKINLSFLLAGGNGY
jgi:hypothetical protein